MKKSSWVVLLLIGGGVFLKIGFSYRAPTPSLLEQNSSKTFAASQFVSEKLGQERPIIYYTSQVKNKIQVLHEMFQSKNDNDPRLDSEFNHLSPEEKEALSQEYQSLPLEQRNERGTLVFLLGRNLENSKDFDFLKQVLSEVPCGNLNNCADSTPLISSHETEASGLQITLQYPQIVALKSLEKYVKENPDSSYQKMINGILRSTARSPSAVVSSLASHLALQTRKK